MAGRSSRTSDAAAATTPAVSGVAGDSAPTITIESANAATATNVAPAMTT
jgi:hypothetical protein